MFTKVIDYCKACYEELTLKTTWPKRNELMHSAVVVLSASLIIALVVWLMDAVSEVIMKAIYPN